MNGLWVLLIVAYASGHNGGGRAIEIQQMRFETERACEAAEHFVSESFPASYTSGYGQRTINTVCIKDEKEQ